MDVSGNRLPETKNNFSDYDISQPTPSVSLSVPSCFLVRNRSYAAKSIECSSYKQGRSSSFIKQVLNEIIQFLPCHVLVLSFGRILNHTEHFIEERYSYYSLSMDTPCFQDSRCNLLGPSR